MDNGNTFSGNTNNWQETSPQPQQPQMQPMNAAMSASEAPKPPKKNIMPIIIVAIVAVLFIGAGVLAVVLANNSGSKTDETAKNEKKKDEYVEPEIKFEDLTKEQVVAFLKDKTNVVGHGILPKGYVGEEIKGEYEIDDNVIYRELEMVYSYGNLDELKEIAIDKYNKLLFTNAKKVTEEDLIIKEYDYYAIVRADTGVDCHDTHYSSCDSLLSFKKDYFDYHRATTRSGSGLTYVDNVMSLKTRDAEVANAVMRAYTLFYSSGWSVGVGNVYDYHFKEEDEKYVLTLDLVTVGYDLDTYDSRSDESIGYKINLFRKTYEASKADGTISIVKSESGDEPNVLKSFKITNQEYLDIYY
jgi:hypothetical protein